jgi:oxalate decarboxylase/phosphoglucose isomerase-like protein (cupin superfamily)
MHTLGRGTITTGHDVDTLSFPWGTLRFLGEPKIDGFNSMCCAIVILEPGQGHGRHNHPGTDEFIYVLSGEAEQMIDDAPAVTVGPGACINIPADVFHSTMNSGWEALKLMVVYSPCGPEEIFRSFPDCKITPAKV